MLKLIFNEDFSHAVMSSSFSQSTIFQITNYSTRQVTMNFNIDAASINNLVQLLSYVYRMRAEK